MDPKFSVESYDLSGSFPVDPKFSVESYDLSGSFLGTELRDRVFYFGLPKDVGIHSGKILLLKNSVYGKPVVAILLSRSRNRY